MDTNTFIQKCRFCIENLKCRSGRRPRTGVKQYLALRDIAKTIDDYKAKMLWHDVESAYVSACRLLWLREHPEDAKVTL